MATETKPTPPILRCKGANGGPSKYTTQRRRIIREALRKGATRKLACAKACISQDTFATWLADYPDFSDQVAHAEAAYIQSLVDTVSEAGTEGIPCETTKVRYEPTGNIGKDGKPEIRVIFQEKTTRREKDPSIALQLLERHPQSKRDFAKLDKLELSTPPEGMLLRLTWGDGGDNGDTANHTPD